MGMIERLTEKEWAALAEAKREALDFQAGRLDRETVEAVARSEMPWVEKIVYTDKLSDVPKDARMEFSISWSYWLVHRVEGHYLTGDDTYERGKIAPWVSDNVREQVKRAERLIALGKSCGAIYSTEDCTLYVVPVPEVHWNTNDPPVLHRADGPACVFGGVASYYWHGTRVPDDWIDGDGPSVQDALQHRNAELRRCAAEILGWERILKEVDARVVHEDPDPLIGTLLEADLPDSPGSRFLRVRCGTGRTHVLPVPSHMTHAKQANAWTYYFEEGWETWEPPAIRT